ncbi:hypothetical protein FB45DRAFT_1060335 [Roridomyces roridus]|uniref:Mid2 domain-containing protein n=1 Tax=Roridomyces roridus TaxID=1738132 RepID=A0AAD7BMN6_9AGAR|nr:hypothetical protein FB45DRAFT_1060335 [Roridomyces roridus]
MMGERHHVLLPLIWKLLLGLLVTQVALSAVLGVAAASASHNSSVSANSSQSSSAKSGSSSGHPTSTIPPPSTTPLPPPSSTSVSNSMNSSDSSSPFMGLPNSTTSHHSRPHPPPSSLPPSIPPSPLNTTTPTDSSPPIIPLTDSGPTGSVSSNTEMATPSANSTTPASHAFNAASKPNNHTAVIAGVVAPIGLILLFALGFILYKRQRRTHDRRVWERTHEAIADAVRQVGSPIPGGGTRAMSPWTHVENPNPSVSRTGTSVGFSTMHERDGSRQGSTDPFVEQPSNGGSAASAESGGMLSNAGRTTSPGPYATAW